MKSPDYEGCFATGLCSRYYRLRSGFWLVAVIGSPRYKPNPDSEWAVTVGLGVVNEGGEPFVYDAIRWDVSKESELSCNALFQAKTPILEGIIRGVQEIGSSDYWTVSEQSFDKLLEVVDSDS